MCAWLCNHCTYANLKIQTEKRMEVFISLGLECMVMHVLERMMLLDVGVLVGLEITASSQFNVRVRNVGALLEIFKV